MCSKMSRSKSLDKVVENIKSTVMEIKSYISSCHVLTNKVSSYFCSKIDKTSRIFWWGKSDEKQKLPEIMRLHLSTKRSGKFGAEKNKRFQKSFDLQAVLEGSNK